MMTDHQSQLYELLVCPDCRTRLSGPSADHLACPNCQRVFPILEGIPQLAILEDESKQPTHEVQETADFFDLYAEDMEKHDGYLNPLPDDPLPDYRSRNKSVMKPHGVWVVIAPYNFPFALAGGPVAAALVTGNTVVFKSATDTPWSGRMLADCLRDAGFPPGVFNYLNGSGSVVGRRGEERERAALAMSWSGEPMGVPRRRQGECGPGVVSCPHCHFRIQQEQSCAATRAAATRATAAAVAAAPGRRWPPPRCTRAPAPEWRRARAAPRRGAGRASPPAPRAAR